MKADWDDAPDHLRRKGPGISPIVIAYIGATAIAAAFFIGLAYWPHSTPVPTEPEPYKPKYDFSESAEPTGPTAEELFWKDQEQRKQQNQPRQTVFNDNNYTPRGADNVVSTEGIRQSAAYQSPIRQENKTVNRTVEHESEWLREWSGEGLFLAEWIAVNNSIDGRSVCANHRRGSIEYRECRKAAKQHFHDQCKAWRARYDSDREDGSYRMQQRFCSAARSFSPMG
ncbi:hypothetical protein [Pseudomonas sp. ML96]|uniref:hypothetical protein n=1 Tax=Pseudomonas sp. ML96 TaxID=1523503 RepID=UPI0005BC9817|nr:hypothetical protein [Pseudomonas sp. ML96]